MFAFHNIREEFDSHLYIGEIPNNEHKKLPYKTTMKINETLPTWGLTLNKVIFDNETFELNKSAIIANGIDGVFLYNKLYKMLEKKILTYSECKINGNAFYKGEENDINQFNYTLFDYEAKTVSFYSDSIYIKDNSDNCTITIAIAIVISVICLVNFVYLFLYKYLYK